MFQIVTKPNFRAITAKRCLPNSSTRMYGLMRQAQSRPSVPSITRAYPKPIRSASDESTLALTQRTNASSNAPDP